MSQPRSSVFRAAALDRLSSPEELDERLRIVSPRLWLALGAVGALLLALAAWAVFGRLAVRVEAEGSVTAAANASGANVRLYLPAREIGRVQPGMRVEVWPVTTQRAARGGLFGIVESVVPRPVPESELAEALRDPKQVERLTRATAMRVTVEVSGTALDAGLPCTARIIVAEQRPIAFILPALAGSNP